MPATPVDAVTGTPLHILESHPHLSEAAMRAIDQTISDWWDTAAAMGPTVVVEMPSPHHRTKAELIDGRWDRPATPEEACSLVFNIMRHFEVDARRGDWRDFAADHLQAIGQELVELAAVVRGDVPHV